MKKLVKASVIATTLVAVATAYVASVNVAAAQSYISYYGGAGDPRVPTELKHWYDDRYPNG
jgi:hypothetical protein